METTDPTSVPTFFPSSWSATNYNELMVAPGEGMSPMTSSNAETDFKPIIIIIIIIIIATSFSFTASLLHALL